MLKGSASAWLGVHQLDDRILDVFHDARLDALARRHVLDEPVARAGVTESARPCHHGDSGRAPRVAPGTPRREDFDVVVLDCPPTLGHVVIAALAAADEALVPVAAHAMELDGLAAVHRSITTVQRRINPNLRLRVLACRVDHRARATEVVDALRARPGEAVLSTVVRENVRVADAPQRAISM
ncbi:MAG: ParA family protein [Euzebyaceae bacterium]|nr:ParA family protein [Euzebyaceae bacterium]